MQKLLDLLKCSKDELPAKLREFRIELGMDPIDFCSAINISDSGMYTMVEEGVFPIEHYLLANDGALSSLIAIVEKNSSLLNGPAAIEYGFDAMDRLLEQQRETSRQVDSLFVQLALEAIKSNDKDALQRLIGIAASTDSEYLPFLIAAHQEG